MEAARSWSDEETTFLRANMDKMNDREIGEAIGRTDSGVANKRRMLRLIRPFHVVNGWKEWEDDFIRENYQRMDDDEMADRIGRTEYAVLRRRRSLGYPRLVKASDSHMRWSEGKAVKTAREYVESLGPIPKYEVVSMLQLRIQDATTCLMNLHANASPDRAWPKADQLMNAKLQTAIVELKQEQAWVYALPELESEAA